MQLCWVAAVGLCGVQGFGDAEGKLLGPFLCSALLGQSGCWG